MNTVQITKLIGGKSVKQVVKSICGEKLSHGCYRDVYVLKSNPDYVIKIERDMTKAMFANVTEWRNYIENKDWEKFGHWLAPCEMINETGQIMIQRRVERWVDNPKKRFPGKIPSLFSDRKKNNFGWIGDQLVCFDYSWLKKVPFKLVRPRWNRI